MNRIIEAAEAVLRRDERNTCQHESTHRGGTIWTICDQCGAKWADDEGGFPGFQEPPEWEALRSAVQALRDGGAEPVAFLKQWMDPDLGPCSRVDQHKHLEAWMLADTRVTPLYATPPTQDAPAPAAGGGEVAPMTPGRACYFMERFLHEEKMLGPNEQAALRYVIGMLEATPTSAPPAEPATRRSGVDSLRSAMERLRKFTPLDVGGIWEECYADVMLGIDGLAAQPAEPAAAPGVVDALRKLVAAVQAETSDEWDCNSYHPTLRPALRTAEQALDAALAAASAPRVADAGRVARDVAYFQAGEEQGYKRGLEANGLKEPT